MKRKGTPKNFEEYLAGIPAPARGALKQMRAVIRSAVPAEAVEKISYGIPAFKHKRVLVWYGAFSKHCSLFPTASVITIQFPTDKPLPAALIKRLLKARVKQNEGKKGR